MHNEIGYPPNSVEGSGAWQWVSDQVVAGICHDLSDRLSSLLGLLQLAELEGTVDSALSDPLRAELRRVEELVHLLRLLPEGRAEVAEPVRLVEVVPTVGALLRRHRGLEDLRVLVEHDADPLIRMRWGTLVRLLLLAVAATGRAVRGAGGSEVVVRIGSAGGVARVEVKAAGLAQDGGDVVGEDVVGGDGRVLETIRAEVEAAGGAVSTSARGGALLLSFPLFGV